VHTCFSFGPQLSSGRWDESEVEETENLIDTIRKNIFDTLTILSCREQQSKYPVPVEWICLWFDDYYHPSDDSFQKAFSTTELEVLSEFNEFFDSAFKKIGDPPAKPDELWVIPEWQQIMQKAASTLRKLIDTQ